MSRRPSQLPRPLCIFIPPNQVAPEPRWIIIRESLHFSAAAPLAMVAKGGHFGLGS